jgi:putative IMPACT (imprinted ancient) family translation regulator
MRPHVDAVYRCLDKYDATKEDEEYSDDGSVYVELSVERGKTDELAATLADLTQGKSRVQSPRRLSTSRGP